MALIALNDAAPDDTIHFSLANSEITLEPGVETDTDSAEIVREAKVHPWIDVIDDQIGDPEAVEVIEPEPDPEPLVFADPDVPAEEPAPAETTDFAPFNAGQEN